MQFNSYRFGAEGIGPAGCGCTAAQQFNHYFISSDPPSGWLAGRTKELELFLLVAMTHV